MNYMKNLFKKHAVCKEQHCIGESDCGTEKMQLLDSNKAKELARISSCISRNQALQLDETLGHILSFLDWKTLLIAELVSKAWLSTIQNNHLWRKLYTHEIKSNPTLESLNHKAAQSVFGCAIEESIHFKKLFYTLLQLEKNWTEGIYSYKEECIGNIRGRFDFMAMDHQRIFIAVNAPTSPNPCEIRIFDRWSFKLQHILFPALVYPQNMPSTPMVERITNITIKGDFMFSAFGSGQIAMWDLKSHQQVNLIQAYVSQSVFASPIICIAENLLITGYDDIDPNKHDSILTIRRILISNMLPKEKEIEMQNTRITAVKSYKGFFVVFAVTDGTGTKPENFVAHIYTCKSLELERIVELPFTFIGDLFDNGLIAKCSTNGTIDFYSLVTESQVSESLPRRGANVIKFDSSRIFALNEGDNDHEIIWWDRSGEKKIREPKTLMASKKGIFYRNYYIIDGVQIVAFMTENWRGNVYLASWDFSEDSF